MYKFSKTKHIHTLKGKYLMGTTSVIREVLPPPLAWYGSGKALEPFGWTNPRKFSQGKRIEIIQKKFDEGDFPLPKNAKEWDEVLQDCYRNHDTYKKEKGNYGSVVHAMIEKIVKFAIKEQNGIVPELKATKADSDAGKAFKQFLNWAQGKKFLYSEVHVYSEELWLGGIIDIVYEEDGKVYLGDVKTSKSIYPNAFYQISLYDIQQSENGFLDKNGNKLGEPIEIHGYEVVNLPKGGKIKTKKYYNTDRLKEFGTNLCQMYDTIRKLNGFLN